MIDASKGFIKDGNKNRLRAQDIHKIVDTFTRQAEIPRYARMVPVPEISDPKNDFNLNLPRYIDSTEPEDIQDIDAHLHGGIPDRDIDALDRYWQVIPSVRAALFQKADRPGYSQLIMDHGQLPEDLSAKGVPPDAADGCKVLGDYLALIEKEAAHSAKVKTAQEALMAKVAVQYGKLTEDEIKTLVVDDKWLARLAAAVRGELDRISQTLTGRIRELAERHAIPLPQLVDEMVLLSARVDNHLKKWDSSHE